MNSDQQRCVDAVERESGTYDAAVTNVANDEIAQAFCSSLEEASS